MFDFKEFRKANKLTQNSAATYFGCGTSFISLIETGRSIIPQSWIDKIMADPTLDKSMIGAVNEKKVTAAVKDSGLVEALQSEIESLKRMNDFLIESNTKQLDLISSQQRMLEAQQTQAAKNEVKIERGVKAVR